ncbi:hypothetical protein MJO28_017838, partial [Puccinia striiformis f. sp. tritici]
PDRTWHRTKFHIPNIDDVTWLYNRLAALLYKLHWEYLSLFNLTTFNHRIQQEILLNWLNEQIIKPNNNSPVLKQVKDLPYDGPLDVPQKENEITQVELIQCFSQERTDACSIVQLTQTLGQQTGDLKESEQSLSLTNEELNGLLMKPDFQEMMKSLKQQASNSAQFGKAVESYKIQGELLSSRSYSTMRQKLSFQITHSYVLSSVANTMVINP